MEKEKNRKSLKVTPPFPLFGIQLEFLLNWSKEKKITDNLTTAKVLPFVIQETNVDRCSYCEKLLKDPMKAHFVKSRADVFISHAWKDKFNIVLEALRNKFQDNLNIFIWFDLFCNNQYIVLDLDFNWWCNTFKSAILTIGKTVMVGYPWTNPTPIQRGWCIWELYCTTQGAIFDIAFPPKAERQFIENIDNDIESINLMFSNIDCEKSSCTNPTDLKRIREAIMFTGGFEVLNRIVFTTLRQWMIERYKKELQDRLVHKGVYDAKTLRAMSNLALIHLHRGEVESAEAYLRDSLLFSLIEFGENNPATIQTMSDLGYCLIARKKFLEAEEILQRGLVILESNDISRNDPVLLRLKRRLASSKRLQGNTTDASKLLVTCIVDVEVDSLWARIERNNLALPGIADMESETRDAFQLCKGRLGCFHPCLSISVCNA